MVLAGVLLAGRGERNHELVGDRRGHAGKRVRTNGVFAIPAKPALSAETYALAVLESDLTISGDGPYTCVGDVLRIIGDGTYAIGMKSGVTMTTGDRIEVASGVSAASTLFAVSIDMSGKSDTAAFAMSGATATLTLTGTNVLKSGLSKAGLEAPQGSTLTIEAAA
jgi:hypothetical protein